MIRFFEVTDSASIPFSRVRSVCETSAESWALARYLWKSFRIALLFYTCDLVNDHREEIDAEIQAELNQIEKSRDANSRSAIWQKLKANGVI
jgi:hypothetical protein